MLSVDTAGFPRRLRQLRMELGWSLEDMSKAVNCWTKSTISNWEALNERRREPSIEALLILAKWFGVSMDYLFGVPGAERDSPAVLKGKAALRDRFPAEVRALDMPLSGARFRLAVRILMDVSPDAYWPERIAAHLLIPFENYLGLLEREQVPEMIVERFARFSGIPVAWFSLRPSDI